MQALFKSPPAGPRRRDSLSGGHGQYRRPSERHAASSRCSALPTGGRGCGAHRHRETRQVRDRLNGRKLTCLLVALLLLFLASACQTSQGLVWAKLILSLILVAGLYAVASHQRWREGTLLANDMILGGCRRHRLLAPLLSPPPDATLQAMGDPDHGQPPGHGDHHACDGIRPLLEWYHSWKIQTKQTRLRSFIEAPLLLGVPADVLWRLQIIHRPGQQCFTHPAAGYSRDRSIREE
jgi:hypothetical protein